MGMQSIHSVLSCFRVDLELVQEPDCQVARKAGVSSEGKAVPNPGIAVPSRALEQLATGPFSKKGKQNPYSAIESFSIFSAQRVCGRTLAAIGYFALREPAESLGLNLKTLEDFCEEVDRNMLGQDYHNRLHVADVLQLMLLQTRKDGPLYPICQTDPKIKLVALLAAMVHDLRHPGVNNAFLKATDDPLVIKYGTQAPAEKMHAALFKDLIQKPHLDFLRPLGVKARNTVINLVESTIMATDMSRHSEFIHAELPSDPEIELGYRLGFAMKISDLSHCLRRFQVHSKFVEMLKAEFYAQGDKEKSLGLPVSFGMDRDETPVQIAQGQIDFLTFFILPLIERYASISSAPLIAQLQIALKRNIQSWSLIAMDASSSPEYQDGKFLTKRKSLERAASTKSDRSHRMMNLARMLSMDSDSHFESSDEYVVHESLKGLQLRRNTAELLKIGLQTIVSGTPLGFEESMSHLQN